MTPIIPPNTRWKTCTHCTTPKYCTDSLRGCDIQESLDAGIEPIAYKKVTEDQIKGEEMIEDEHAGMHRITPLEMCRDREHNPPSMLYIPPGHKYVHYCPSCRQKSVLYGGVEVLM